VAIILLAFTLTGFSTLYIQYLAGQLSGIEKESPFIYKARPLQNIGFCPSERPPARSGQGVKNLYIIELQIINTNCILKCAKGAF
jgi:hypothetical protein